jgi:hypothetical protein
VKFQRLIERRVDPPYPQRVTGIDRVVSGDDVISPSLAPSYETDLEEKSGWSHCRTVSPWGRGIERILEACREARTPAPDLRYEHTGLWVEFRFLLEHAMAATPEVVGEVEQLVLVLVGRMSRAQIQQALGLGMRTTSEPVP